MDGTFRPKAWGRPRADSTARSRYLYSSHHIIGCIGGLAAFVAYLIVDVQVHWYWFGISGYALGMAATCWWHHYTQSRHEPVMALMTDRIAIDEQSTDLNTSLQSVINLMENTHPLVPENASGKLDDIRRNLTNLVSILQKSTALDQDVHAVHQILDDYLPATLSAFLAIPAVYTQTRIVADDKTAVMLLEEQLGIIDKYLNELIEKALNNNIDSMIINGRFLAERLKPQDYFSVPNAVDKEH